MTATAALVDFRHRVDTRAEVSQTDESLVLRVRAGDDTAFEAIYDRYARGMLAFCIHMLGSREAAEDALQQSLVSAYRALRGGGSDVSLRPWLYTIARNRCLSELRSGRDVIDLDGVALDLPSFDGPADRVQRREELRELLDDLHRLPADQRAALVLFELGDHSHTEIADVIGVRREKVKALIFQAREALVRGRQARGHPCDEIRERLATHRGRVVRHAMTRAHIDRCPSCAAFEGEVNRQRAAFALLLPVTLTGALKSSVMGSALGGSGAVAVGAGACGTGAVVPGGATAVGGATAAGGGTVAGGACGTGAVATGTGTAGGLAAASTGAAGTAIATGAPVAAVATGLTTVGGMGVSGVVAKLLTVAVIATGAAGANLAAGSAPRHQGPAGGAQISFASAGYPARATIPILADAGSGSTVPGARATGSVTPVSATTTSTGPEPATTEAPASGDSGSGTAASPVTLATSAPGGPGSASPGPPLTSTTSLPVVTPVTSATPVTPASGGTDSPTPAPPSTLAAISSTPAATSATGGSGPDPSAGTPDGGPGSDPSGSASASGGSGSNMSGDASVSVGVGSDPSGAAAAVAAGSDISGTASASGVPGSDASDSTETPQSN